MSNHRHNAGTANVGLGLRRHNILPFDSLLIDIFVAAIITVACAFKTNINSSFFVFYLFIFIMGVQQTLNSL